MITITLRARWEERERGGGKLISFANNATIQHFRSPCVCVERWECIVYHSDFQLVCREYFYNLKCSITFFFFIIHSGLLTSYPLDRQTKILQQPKKQLPPDANSLSWTISITFFDTSQNFSNCFTCAVRWKRLKIAGLPWSTCTFYQ